MELSMGDIAVLGRVKRPVVTVWRRRYADGPAPFPSPVGTDPLRFDAGDIIGWLAATGLGNNPKPGAELAALRLRHTVPRGPLGVRQLSAMLTLRHLYGDALVEDVARPEDVLAAARTLEESAAIIDDLPEAHELPAVARAVEEFVDHHLGVADAHRWLAEHWFLTAWPELAHHRLDPALSQLIVRTAVAIADTLEAPTLEDAQGNGLSWLPMVPPSWDGSCRVAGAGPLARYTRRCALLAERDTRSAPEPAEAIVAVDLVLDESPTDARQRLALSANHAVQLTVGPARELCDPLPGAQSREAALRDGVVRAIIKLPPGLRSTNPREHLAIWLLARRDDEPFDEQRTFVADLSGVAVASSMDDVVSDLRAAVLDPAAHGRRNWQLLRPVRTSHLLARSGSLLAAPPRRASAVRDPEGAVKALRELAETVSLSRAVRFVPAPEGKRSIVSVAQATRRGWLRALPGLRLGSDQLPSGNVAVWGSSRDAVAVKRQVDRLAALALPRVWLTEPGDIIFRGAGAVVVDVVGGALVESPARALRVVAGAPVLPEQIARAIGAGAPGTTADHWQFGLVDDARRAGMSVISGRISERRADLLEELQHLQDFEERLFGACENQLVNLEVD